MKQTDIFSLNIRDFLKGLVIAVILPVLMIVQNQFENLGTTPFSWKQIAMAAVGAFISYLIKNFFTNSIGEAKLTLQRAKEEGKNENL